MPDLIAPPAPTPFRQTPLGSLVCSTWFLPTTAAALSVRRSLVKKRSTPSLLIHAAGSYAAVVAIGIALGMSGVLSAQ